jgi:hypothetical protein
MIYAIFTFRNLPKIRSLANSRHTRTKFNKLFCLFEGWERQKYSFPSPRVSLGGTRSFLSKNLPEHCTANHGVWIKCIFEQLDRISNVVVCLPQAGLPPTPKPTGCVLNCSTMHKYPTLNLYCTVTLAWTQYFPEEKTASAPCMGWAVALPFSEPDKLLR